MSAGRVWDGVGRGARVEGGTVCFELEIRDKAKSEAGAKRRRWLSWDL